VPKTAATAHAFTAAAIVAPAAAGRKPKTPPLQLRLGFVTFNKSSKAGMTDEPCTAPVYAAAERKLLATTAVAAAAAGANSKWAAVSGQRPAAPIVLACALFG